MPAQVLSFTRHMAARLPSTYATATGAAEWTRLSWVPDPGTRYANDFSEAAGVIVDRPMISPPPAPLVSEGSSAGGKVSLYKLPWVSQCLALEHSVPVPVNSSLGRCYDKSNL